MSVIILTQSFIKKELKPVSRIFTKEALYKAIAKKDSSAIVLSDVGQHDQMLMKMRVPGKTAGRLVVLVMKTSSDRIIPLMLRPKTDKVFGENIAMSNKKVKQHLNTMHDLALEDITKGDFEVIHKE